MFTHLHIGNAQYLDLMDLNELDATIMKPFGEGSNFKHLPWIEMNLMYPYKYIYNFFKCKNVSPHEVSTEI